MYVNDLAIKGKSWFYTEEASGKDALREDLVIYNFIVSIQLFNQIVAGQRQMA